MATPGQQAAQALRQGGVTEFADTQPNVDEGIQTANFLTQILKQSAKAAPGVARKEIDKGVAGRVPEPIAEGVMPEGTTVQSTQEALAKDALSPEGQNRLAGAGGDARTAISMPTERELADQPDLFGPAEPEVPVNQQVTKNAQMSMSGLETVARSESAIADAGDADDLIRMVTEPGMVDDGVGIDFNFDNFDGGEDINRVVNAMSDIIKNPTEAEKRGIVTNKETLANAGELLADEVGFTRNILRKQSGKALNAEEMTALRILLQRSGAKLEEMAVQIQSGLASPKAMIDFRRQMSVHAGIQMKAKGAQTEIARAMQAFKIPVGTQVPADVMDGILKEAGGTGLVKKMARGYLDALAEGGQVNANKYVSGSWSQKTEDVWMEVYMNGLLSYFPTHFKNALSTPLFMTYNVLTDLMSASIGATFRSGARLAGRDADPDGVHFEDVFARVHGMSKSIGDAWTVAAKGFASEVPADTLNKVEGATFRAIDRENLNIDDNTIGKGVDFMGRVIRLPGRGLMFADDFFKTIASRGALYEESVRAYRRSKHMGRNDAEAMDDAMMVMLDPKYATDEMDSAARYATMTTDLGDGVIGRFTNAFRGSMLGKLVMPFAKAPTNTVKIVGEGHPLIQGLAALNPGSSKVRDTLLGKNGPQARDRALGRLAMATTTFAGFHELAQNGRITGSYPVDKDLQRLLPPGWQPYSMVFRGENFPVDADGDSLPLYNKETGIPNGPLTYMSYQGLEPVSAFIGIAASTARHQTMFVDPEDKLNLLSASTVATMEYFRDLPMLQGIATVYKAFQYEDPSMITDGFLGCTVAVFPMPFSAVVRNVEKLSGDNVKKKVDQPYQYYSVEDVNRLYDESQGTDNPYSKVPYSLVGTVKNWQDASWSKMFYEQVAWGWEQQIMNIPYVNKIEENYAFQYDMLGDKKTRGLRFDINPKAAVWSSVTPFKMAFGAEVEPYHRELIRLGAPLTESRDKKKILGVSLSERNRGELTNIAKNKITLPIEVMTKRGRRQQGPARYVFKDYLKVLMTVPLYTSSDDDVRANMIRNAEARFYRAAVPVLLNQPGNQDLRSRLAERKQLKDQGAF